MIPEIRNTILRRVALVLTVIAFIAVIGPLALINAVFEWLESEFDVNLRDVWDGVPTKKESK
jgi:hypothetical protein